MQSDSRPPAPDARAALASERAARSYLACLLLVALAGVALVLAFNLAVDPLQYYHRAIGYAPHYSDNQRYQAPALARTHPHQVVVLGNSHAANFEPSRVQEALGGTTLNLTLEGSIISEQSLLAALVLRQQKVRRIVWIVDFNAFSLATAQVHGYAEQLLPMHLYGHPLRAAGPYLLSLDTLRHSVQALAGPPPHTLETLTSWWHEHSYGRERVEAAWDYMRARWTPQVRAQWAASAADAGDVGANFERWLLVHVQAHPEVRFDLVFPPFSLYEYASDFLLAPGRFFLRVHLKRLALQAEAANANLTVWDFEGWPDVVQDLARYKDLGHYDRNVVDAMLQLMASGTPPQPDLLRVAHALREFLDARCAASAEDLERFCPVQVRCGQQQLGQWLDQGATTAWPEVPCH